MAAWSQVFDDGAALVAARRRARRLLIGFGVISVVVVSAAPLATVWGGAPAGGVVLLCGALLSACAGVVLHRLGRLHRRWCRFEVSTLGIAATDTAGRRTALLWRSVDTVDVADGALTVRGHDLDGRSLTIDATDAAPRFDALARYVVRCAYAHRCGLSIDGCALDALPIDGLADRTQPKSRGGSAETAG